MQEYTYDTYEPLDGRSYTRGDLSSYLKAIQNAASGYNSTKDNLERAQKDVDALTIELERYKKELDELLMMAPKYAENLE